MTLLKEHDTKDRKDTKEAATIPGLVSLANERFATVIAAKGGQLKAGAGEGDTQRLVSAVCHLDPREASTAAWGPTIDQLAEAWVAAKWTTWGLPPEGYRFMKETPGESGVRLLWSYDVSADVWLGRFDVFGHP